MISRRDLLASTAALASASPLRRVVDALAVKPFAPLGVQLYTIRESMQRDFGGTLARVRGIGYREVEFAGYFGHAPREIRQLLRTNGLSAPGAHVGLDALTTGLTATLDAAEEIGHRWVVLPWIDQADRTPAGYDRIGDALNAAGQAAHRRGIRVAYHNHDFDLHPWPNGEVPLERLTRRLDPRVADVELDLYWVTKGGGDAKEWLRRFPGRFPLVHVKDAGPAPDFTMADVGAGAMDWRGIFALRRTAGIKHYFIEHDTPQDPWASIEASFRYLSTLRV